jgi:hypothetical protein
MPQQKPTLILVYEPEATCRARLIAEGFSDRHALEISSYLAQSTDLAPEFPAIGKACAERGLDFLPLELDGAAAGLAGRPVDSTLVWTLTDGIAYFRGGVAPALARLNGLPTIGADDSLCALCQDKFRSGAVLSALGLPIPPAGLAANGEWLVEPPASSRGWFVKPNRLGAKIGIWPDSHCQDWEKVLDLSRRVFDAYRDTVVVQPYVPGRNVRASFLAVRPETGPEALGIFFVDSGGDFQTMDDSMALYGGTGAEAIASGIYAEPKLVAVEIGQPEAAAKIRAIAARLMQALGLRDVFYGFPRRAGRHRPPHRIRSMSRPAMLRFSRLLPLAMWAWPRRRDGRDSREPVFHPTLKPFRAATRAGTFCDPTPPRSLGLHQADTGHPQADEAQPVGGSLGQVDNPALDEGAAVVDTHDYRLAVLLVGDLELGAEGKRAVRGGEIRRIHLLARSGLRVERIPGCAAALCRCGRCGDKECASQCDRTGCG